MAMAGEKAFLNDLLTCKHPGSAQLILVYGRSRAGKSELLLHWAAQRAQSSLEFTHWKVVKGTASYIKPLFCISVIASVENSFSLATNA
jgi:AAA+ ATPase superfamily predicted ATPase